MLKFSALSALSFLISCSSCLADAAEPLDPNCPNVSRVNAMTPGWAGGKQYPLPQFGLACNSLYCKAQVRGFETKDNLKVIDQTLTEFQAATQRFADSVTMYGAICKAYMSSINGDGREKVVDALGDASNMGDEAMYIARSFNDIKNTKTYRFNEFANFVIEKENDPNCSKEIRKVVHRKFKEFDAQATRLSSGFKCSRPDAEATAVSPR